MHYWVMSGLDVLGPYQMADMQSMIDRGTLQPGHMVMRGDEGGWELAGTQMEWSWAKPTPEAAPVVQRKAGTALLCLLFPPIAAIFGLTRLASDDLGERAVGRFILIWSGIGVLVGMVLVSMVGALTGR
jgi:hypothetical protein